MSVRTPAVAGSFYPEAPPELENALDQAFAAASQVAVSDVVESAHKQPSALSNARDLVGNPAVKALVVPHAGWMFSGSTAANAYRLLAGRFEIQRVVILGPAHRVWVPGLAMSSDSRWQTPTGELAVHYSESLRELPFVDTNDDTHAHEHSLEVQLPFIQRMLGDVEISPLVVGSAPAEQVAEALDAVWGGPETLILISTDLSHYLGYRHAIDADRETIQKILWLDSTVVSDRACGSYPLNGMLLAAKRRGMNIRLLASCNSGDASGNLDRVVGYAAFALTENSPTDATK
ncbi:AmmeMemoRadiSam system protein B [Trueperella bonasi]|uniref:MEMO1 family protein J2S70_001423 n=1 Tax=Trueperella bonasi TaxID=312286 RepID=A0ABT9NHG0_9ACTO|nr:AmmeMemoRadiSam system protein B [Trueperella bonasi]MDP9806841.1 AmmeMemoRadiSam system protein B [Trueperella bonasi]